MTLSESARLLRGGPALDSVRVEKNWARAQFFAWSATYGEDEFTWTDLRQLERSNIEEAIYERPDESALREALAKDEAILLQRLQQLQQVQKLDILDDVYADLRNCLAQRAVFGTGEGFFEELFRVYASGGWPCGWEGPYPDSGKLIAYYP
ncbi:MAG TPA: hypothetical protein VFQ61_08480 [Polyangiaceae bacterium]|nr:hypothetical protein [Polyangiaceae bacterium]